MKILVKLLSLKFLTSLLGLFYSILQVRLFGVSRSIEVYFAAQSMVYLVTSLTQSGQLAEVFLPEYHRLNNIAPKLGYSGLNVVLNRMVLWGTLVIMVVFIATPFIVEIMIPGFEESDKIQTALIFRILLPYLYLQLMNSFFITVLNAEKDFVRAVSLGFSNTIVNIIILVVFYEIIGIWALVVSLLFGKIIEFIFYVYQLYKKGYRYHFVFSIPEFDHIEFFNTMKGTFTYVGAAQVYNIVLTASISFLPVGTYAIFKYVQNLANKIRSVFVQPFMTMFFTEYSLLLHQGESVKKEFYKYIGIIVNVNTITIVGSILLGDYFINLIWGGDNFGLEEVKLAYTFLLFNIVAVMFDSLSTSYRKMSVANNKGKALYYYWSFAQIISAGLSYFLIKFFGVFGLFFIIPLNSLLMGSVSYFIYKKTKNPLRLGINDFNLWGIVVSIVIVVLIRLNVPIYGNQYVGLVIFVIATIAFSMFPMINIYKLVKK